MKLILTYIKKYLKEPYPYYYSSQQRLVLLLLFISILSFCFSYFFEPFTVTVTEHKIDAIWILLIHACIPFPIAYIYISLMDKMRKDDITWTLGKEIFHLSVILFIIGIVDFLIRDLIYTNHNNWSFQYLWEEIRNTFLVGFLILIIVLPLNLERLINKHTSSLKNISIHTLEPNNTFVSLVDSGSSEKFKLEIKNFLFARVESNYTEIFTSSSDGINKTLIRITLKEVEAQLNSFTHIYKTHRSYLVNLHAIKSISGNAQGYQLTLKKGSMRIPVSRSNIATFNAVYSKV
ncbi:LytTR family DNA-binding domain-containing protein [Dokdonia sp.]|uniref:LytR/AlgR family response regulator transcription factor n=1 Tax=Dokdonia sp. TaxID=2024995 RepID=UPI0032672F6D